MSINIITPKIKKNDDNPLVKLDEFNPFDTSVPVESELFDLLYTFDGKLFIGTLPI